MLLGLQDLEWLLHRVELEQRQRRACAIRAAVQVVALWWASSALSWIAEEPQGRPGPPESAVCIYLGAGSARSLEIIFK